MTRLLAILALVLAATLGVVLLRRSEPPYPPPQVAAALAAKPSPEVLALEQRGRIARARAATCDALDRFLRPSAVPVTPLTIDIERGYLDAMIEDARRWQLDAAIVGGLVQMRALHNAHDEHFDPAVSAARGRAYWRAAESVQRACAAGGAQ